MALSVKCCFENSCLNMKTHSQPATETTQLAPSYKFSQSNCANIATLMKHNSDQNLLKIIIVNKDSNLPVFIFNMNTNTGVQDVEYLPSNFTSFFFCPPFLFFHYSSVRLPFLFNPSFLLLFLLFYSILPISSIFPYLFHPFSFCPSFPVSVTCNIHFNRSPLFNWYHSIYVNWQRAPTLVCVEILFCIYFN